MQSYTDHRGLELHAPTAAHVEAFQQACELFHGYYVNPVDAIDRALEQDPDFILGQVLKAGIYATATEKAAYPVIDDALERLQRLAPHANERERGHIEALAAWRAGRFDEATERWGRVSIDHPRDLLALQFAHLGDFYQGQSLMLRDRPARVLHAWTPDVPGHGFVRSMFAFGMEESGHYPEAEAAGKAALDANPRDPWAVHAVAH
ncbi:MAG TPA: tetratricopeptide repeat protein, partial [Burkholderiaceae bacterium]|nr:tetratricopeptide repeat protein [Burkholderiaceae bacterium]